MGVRARLAGSVGAAVLAMAGGAVMAQTDPFAALYGPPAGAPSAPGQRGGSAADPSAVIGVQSVGAAVGKSYAGSNEGGTTSLAQIAMLPGTVPPFEVPLKGSGVKYLTGRPRILVASYALGLQRDASLSASAAGAGSDLTPRRTTLTTRLEGISDQLGARLAQEAYDDLVARLTAAGFEVVTPEQASAAPHIQSLGRYAGQASGQGAVVYGPARAPLIRGYALETGIASLAASGSLIAMGQASKELDAVILTPELMLNHVGMGGTGQRNFVGSASVDARLRFAIVPPSRIDFVWGNERGGAMPGVFIPKPAGSDELFGVMVRREDRSDDVGLHNAFAEAGMGSVYRQSLVYGVRADPGRFSALCRAAFQGFNTALVEEIRRARTS